jgi:hypothetical protein
MDETNLLNIIKPWLDINYQITTKNITVAFYKIFQKLNEPPVSRWKEGEKVVVGEQDRTVKLREEQQGARSSCQSVKAAAPQHPCIASCEQSETDEMGFCAGSTEYSVRGRICIAGQTITQFDRCTVRTEAPFTCQKIVPKFSDFPSHRIFERMHETLNIDKK